MTDKIDIKNYNIRRQSLSIATTQPQYNQRSAISIQKDEKNRTRIIFIISDIYVYAIILSLISSNFYSYSKFEAHIVFILNNTYDVNDYDSLHKSTAQQRIEK